MSLFATRSHVKINNICGTEKELVHDDVTLIALEIYYLDFARVGGFHMQDSGINPVKGSIHRFFPLPVVFFPYTVFHGRLPGFIDGPVFAQLLRIGPVSDSHTGGIGGAQSRRLRNGRSNYRHVEQISLKLHEQLVGDHAAVHAQDLPTDEAGLVGAEKSNQSGNLVRSA